MRRIIGPGLLAAVLCLTAAPSHADGSQVLHGPDFPDDSTFLTYVSCDGFFGEAAPPQLRVNLGPASAPLGRRSVGFVPSGAGTAAGTYVRVPSLAGATSTLSVTAASGTRGVSYVWYAAPDAPLGHAWSGRADLSVAPGGWQQVDAASLTYTWTLVDLVSLQPVGPRASATLGEFTSTHGAGPGYVVTGFGCDGAEFNVDAVRAGSSGDVTTYDLEGLQVATTIAATQTRVAAGRPTVLTGTVTDAGGRVLGDPLVLQARAPGAAQWRVVEELVLADPDGVVRVKVTPESTTDYRWQLPESQYADAGVSAPVTVTVAPRG